MVSQSPDGMHQIVGKGIVVVENQDFLVADMVGQFNS
jgi:hypothetical protein